MIQIKPRLTALGALTLLTACEPPPPPPLSATPIVWAHKGCGERGLPVTITTTPGAEVVGLGSGEQLDRGLNGVHGTGRRHRILLDQERLQALQVLQRLERETNPVMAHDCLLVDRP